MNMDQLKGDWKQIQGKVKAKWGKLTDDDMTVIEGKRDELAGKIQERYGMAKALQLVGLPLEGTHHRGIDDARNIAKLLPYILGEKQLP